MDELVEREPALALLRERLQGADALLVSDLTNIRWLTGFTGSNGWVVLGPDSLTLVTDGRYGDQAAQQMAAAGVTGDDEPPGETVTLDVLREGAEIFVALSRDHVALEEAFIYPQARAAMRDPQRRAAAFALTRPVVRRQAACAQCASQPGFQNTTPVQRGGHSG